ncbi:MAG: carboxypeptidase regulatory-like domain-containing protein, partial [Planctomycetota bacterium]
VLRSQKEQDMKPEEQLARADLKKMVMDLPLELRTPIVLKYVQEATLGEIAEILGCSTVTVSNRLRKGLGRLKEAMAQGGYAAVIPVIEVHLLSLEGEGISSSLLGKLSSLLQKAATTGTVSGGVSASKMLKILAGTSLVVLVSLAFLVLLTRDHVTSRGLIHPSVEGSGAPSGDAREGPLGTALEDPELDERGRKNGRGAPNEEDSPESGKSKDNEKERASGGAEETRSERSAPGEEIPGVPILTGCVVDSRGAPIPGASVNVVGSKAMSVEEMKARMEKKLTKEEVDRIMEEGFRLPWTPRETRATTRTDGKGTFFLESGEVEEGGYCIRVSAQGFATAILYGIRLKSDPEPTYIKVLLRDPAPLSGKVVDSLGNPVARAFVVADRPWDPDFFQRNPFVKTNQLGNDRFFKTADEQGRFHFHDLPVAAYEIRVWKPGLLATSKSAKLPADREIEIVIPSGVTLEGQVLDRATGEPIQGARVGVGVRGSIEEPSPVKTDSKGRFRFRNLRPGIYIVNASAGEYWKRSERGVADPGELIKKKLLLERKRYISVSGVVLAAESDAPVSGAVVFPSWRFHTVSGPGGAFRIDRALVYAPGESGRKMPSPGDPSVVRLKVFKPGRMLEEVQVAVSREDPFLDQLRISLELAPRAVGRVVDSAGCPVVGASLVTIPGERTGYREAMKLLSEPVKRNLTDTKGRFDISFHSTGKVHVKAWKRGYAAAVKTFENLRAGETVKDVVIRFAEGGAVDGVAADLEGRGLSRRKVEAVFIGEGEEEDGSRSLLAWHIRDMKRTDHQGRFSFQHLTPGRWQFTVIDRITQEAEEYGLGLSRATVAEGKTVNLRLRLERLQAIRGLVTDASGIPLPKTLVSIGRVKEEVPTFRQFKRTFVRCEKDGSFTIGGLVPGLYRIRAICEGFDEATFESVKPGTQEIKIVLERRK